MVSMKNNSKLPIFDFEISLELIAMAMNLCCFVSSITICSNLLRCQISCHIQLSSFNASRLNLIDEQVFFSFWSFRFGVVVFSSFVCAPVDRSPVEPSFVEKHTHPSFVYDLRRFSLNFICNRTKANCISLLFGFQHRTHTSFHPIQKYSIHRPHSLCYSLLHMRFDRIGVFFLSSIRSSLLCSRIPLFDRIQWDSNLFRSLF